jgi:hypothetical protein
MFLYESVCWIHFETPNHIAFNNLVADRHIFPAIFFFFFCIKTQYILAILSPLWPRSQKIMWVTCRCGTLTDKRFVSKVKPLLWSVSGRTNLNVHQVMVVTSQERWTSPSELPIIRKRKNTRVMLATKLLHPREYEEQRPADGGLPLLPETL